MQDGSNRGATLLTSAPRIAAYKLMFPAGQGDPLHHSSQQHTSRIIHTGFVVYRCCPTHQCQRKAGRDYTLNTFQPLFHLLVTVLIS